MPILSILIALLILCVVYWAAEKLMAAFGVGEPIHTVVIVLLVILALVYLFSLISAGPRILQWR